MTGNEKKNAGDGESNKTLRQTRMEQTKKKTQDKVAKFLRSRVKRPVLLIGGGIALATSVFLCSKSKDTTHVKSINTTFGELVPAQDRTGDILLGDKTISYEDAITIKGEQGIDFMGKELFKDILGSLDDAERKLLIESIVEFGYKYDELVSLPIHVTDSTLSSGESRRLIEFDVSAPDTLKAVFTDKCQVQDEDNWYNLSMFQDSEKIEQMVNDLKAKDGKKKVYDRFLQDMHANGEEYRYLAAKKFRQILVSTTNLVEGNKAPEKTMLKITFNMNGKRYTMVTTDGAKFVIAIDTDIIGTPEQPEQIEKIKPLSSLSSPETGLNSSGSAPLK